MPVSKILKPHVTIYKDLDTVITDEGNTEYLKNLNGGKVLHIADLITEASSYERAWIPAIKEKGGQILWSVVVVDRMQEAGNFFWKMESSLFHDKYRY